MAQQDKISSATAPDAIPPSADGTTQAEQPDPAAPRSEQPPSVPRWGTPTLGGMQFWGDLSYSSGWKIQRHVFTGHCRLLDPTNCRYASGTLEQCQQVLNVIRQDRNLKPISGNVVVLVHGIGRSSHSFRRMATALTKAGYTVVPFEYPSTRISIEQAAEYLRSVTDSLPQNCEIHFVVHSMGGLVVRALLQPGTDLRFRSMVMLATPNQGAEMADLLKSSTLFQLVYGPAGQQLVTADQGQNRKLPVPEFPFGIIAGSRGNASGFNRLIPGDDDGTVTVDSTRLPGAADFLQVPRLHSFLMGDATVIEATLHFLRHQRFQQDQPANPIPSLPDGNES